MRRGVLLAVVAAIVSAAVLQGAPEPFNIKIVRKPADTTGLVTGTLSVNGTALGPTFENDAKKISKGTYKGFMRYVSGKNFVAGPLGTIGQKGDFLLEVGEVVMPDGTKRTNILFHGGNKAEQSEGCIMLGGVPKDKDGVPMLPADHTLSKLRRMFYGTDDPISSPNKAITIDIVDSGT